MLNYLETLNWLRNKYGDLDGFSMFIEPRNKYMFKKQVCGYIPLETDLVVFNDVGPLVENIPRYKPIGNGTVYYLCEG